MNGKDIKKRLIINVYSTPNKVSQIWSHISGTLSELVQLTLCNIWIGDNGTQLVLWPTWFRCHFWYRYCISECWFKFQLLHFWTISLGDVPGKEAKSNLSNWTRTTQVGSSRVLDLDWFNPNYCSHLENEPLNGRFLCLYLSLSLYVSMSLLFWFSSKWILKEVIEVICLVNEELLFF